MAEPKIYPNGIKYFKPNEKAPDFVKGDIYIEPVEFIAWMRANAALMVKDKNGVSKFKLQATDKGLNVNTWKPNETTGHKDFQPAKVEPPKGQTPDFSEVPF